MLFIAAVIASEAKQSRCFSGLLRAIALAMTIC